jgi:hypothetical protein
MTQQSMRLQFLPVLNREQFDKAYRKYMDDAGYAYEQYDVDYEWARYQRGRSWLNSFATVDGLFKPVGP